MNFNIYEILIALPGLLIAMTFHELAHGYAAYKLGDPTAKESGRLTLNPIKHVDIIGLLLLIFARFGWAKPVPINPSYFKNRKKGMIITSFAGPLMNFILAISFSVLRVVLIKYQFINSIMNQVLISAIIYNIVLGIFNLLPFPPLDGSKIVASLLPTKYEMKVYRYERYLYLILIILVITNTIDEILWPLVNFGLDIIDNIGRYFL